MTFTLQTGDYIPTSEVPADKQQVVIDAFVAALERMVSVYTCSQTTSNWRPKVAAHKAAEEAITKARSIK